MALLLELVCSVVLLAKQSCIFGLRSVGIVVLTWLELLRFALSLHFVILWRVVVCSIALLSLPVRAFTALCRERQLEMQVHRLKNEMENLVWDRKELEEQLRVAIRQAKMVEVMLMELEEEHDEAILKIEQLQAKVQDLKAETQQLQEMMGKSHNNTNNVDDKSSWKPDYDNRLGIRYDHVLEESGWRNEGNFSVAKQREIALCRSLFSAILSLLVGVVVLEAKEDAACTPLLVALFTVVIMSLISVVRLFTKNEHNKLALALLSTNCFILGTLAYHMLPTIARFSPHFSHRLSATDFSLVS